MKQRRQRNEVGLASVVYVPAGPVAWITFLLILPGSVCASEERTPATILRIIDGDTLIATLNNTPTRVRLANIDAPELTQPGGPASRDYLVSLITSRTITIHSHGRDRYGRTLATLFAGDCNINLAMVRAGYAWRYRYARKSGPIADAEALARAEGRGLWATDGAVAPWVFRKGEGRLPADLADRRRLEREIGMGEGDVAGTGVAGIPAPLSSRNVIRRLLIAAGIQQPERIDEKLGQLLSCRLLLTAFRQALCLPLRARSAPGEQRGENRSAGIPAGLFSPHLLLPPILSTCHAVASAKADLRRSAAICGQLPLTRNSEEPTI